VTYNHLTDIYETPDGTTVSALLVDGAQCVADVLHIAAVREQQRVAMTPNVRGKLPYSVSLGE
jgi:hypothetical protein